MKVLTILLVVISFVVLFFGMSVSEGAPQEAVVVGLCCFLAILARIAQAESHQKN
jgi:hypothetical protein